MGSKQGVLRLLVGIYSAAALFVPVVGSLVICALTRWRPSLPGFVWKAAYIIGLVLALACLFLLPRAASWLGGVGFPIYLFVVPFTLLTSVGFLGFVAFSSFWRYASLALVVLGATPLVIVLARRFFPSD